MAEPLSSKRFLWFLAVGTVMALSVFIYWPALHGEFITTFDDATILVGNSAVVHFDLKRLLTQTVIADYIPVTLFSFALENWLFGLHPFVFHLDNLILHLMNSALVFLLLQNLLRRRVEAGVVAALFSVHPLHVESVAWIAERKDVLSGFFYLLSLLLYVRATRNAEPQETPRRRRFWLIASAWVLFALSLLSKLMAISLPMVLLLIDAYRGRRFDRRSLTEKIPFFAIAIGLTFVNPQFHRISEYSSHDGTSLIQAGSRAIEALDHYVAATLVPTGLSAVYERQAVALSGFALLWQTVLLVLVVGFFWFARDNRRPGLFAIAFWLVTIAPTLQVATFSRAFDYADRFMYLPSIGLFLGLVLVLGQARMSQAFKGAIFILVLGGLSVIAHAHCMSWSDDSSFWRAIIERYPGTKLAHNNLGVTLVKKEKNTEGGIEEFQTALRIDPNFSSSLDAMGALLITKGEVEKGKDMYFKSLRQDPKDTVALFNLAQLAMEMGDFVEARVYLRHAILVDPDNSVFYCNLGAAAYKANDLREAAEVFQKCVELDRFNAAAHSDYGAALVGVGRKDEGIGQFKQALTLKPNLEAARKNLASLQGN